MQQPLLNVVPLADIHKRSVMPLESQCQPYQVCGTTSLGQRVEGEYFPDTIARLGIPSPKDQIPHTPIRIRENLRKGFTKPWIFSSGAFCSLLYGGYSTNVLNTVQYYWSCAQYNILPCTTPKGTAVRRASLCST